MLLLFSYSKLKSCLKVQVRINKVTNTIAVFITKLSKKDRGILMNLILNKAYKTYYAILMILIWYSRLNVFIKLYMSQVKYEIGNSIQCLINHFYASIKFPYSIILLITYIQSTTNYVILLTKRCQGQNLKINHVQPPVVFSSKSAKNNNYLTISSYNFIQHSRK